MRRLTCLDGVRGVLALYVMASHILPFAVLPGGWGWLGSLLSHGGAAVDMFFVLSGLVILRSLQAFQGRPGAFLLARASRIFPVYLLAFAVAVAIRPFDHGIVAMPWIAPDSPTRLLVSDGWPDTALVEIGVHLVMLHGLFPDGVLPHAWVRFLGAAWSLSTEWQFYVLALGLACWRVRESRLVMVFLLLAAIGLGWHMMAPAGWQFSRAFLPNKAQYFALGIASAALLARGRAAWPGYMLTLMAAMAISFDQGGWGKLAAPLAWTVCLGAQLGVLGKLAWMLRHPVLLWLGAISYPLYIAHEPIHKLLSIALAAVAAGDAVLFSLLWLPAAVLVPVLAAWGLHVAVELPAQRWGRGRAGRPALAGA